MASSIPAGAGFPQPCPACGSPVAELVDPVGMALCPKCGRLLGFVRDYLSRTTGHDPETITLDTRLADLGLDSLDVVEVTMEMEAHGVWVPEQRPERIESILDWLRQLKQTSDDSGDSQED